MMWCGFCVRLEAIPPSNSHRMKFCYANVVHFLRKLAHLQVMFISNYHKQSFPSLLLCGTTSIMAPSMAFLFRLFRQRPHINYIYPFWLSGTLNEFRCRWKYAIDSVRLCSAPCSGTIAQTCSTLKLHLHILYSFGLSIDLNQYWVVAAG